MICRLYKPKIKVSAHSRDPLLLLRLDDKLLHLTAREPQFEPLFQFAPTINRRSKLEFAE